CHENGVIATKMQSTKPAKTNESTPRTNKGSRVQIPLVRLKNPVIPPFSRHRNGGVFTSRGQPGAMYRGFIPSGIKIIFIRRATYSGTSSTPMTFRL
ncbi:MAG: hypothetical protein U0L14_06680, partial [Bifidobacterium ruminantium]|nr:hypothetical protein [Bifidobacterium ruminantium]